MKRPFLDLEDFVWHADGTAALAPVNSLPDIDDRDRATWLAGFLPRLAAALIRDTVGGHSTYLPPTAHVGRNWILRLSIIREGLANRAGHLLLVETAQLNYYRVDFAASRKLCEDAVLTHGITGRATLAETQMALL